MSGILESIVAERRGDVARNRAERPASGLRRSAPPPRRAFDPARPFALIAECKRASPSKGVFLAEYDPVALAGTYEAGGADLLSVLTEPRRFLGSDAHLEALRRSTALPILRKDFIVDEYQVRESWALGADAILLIAAALPPALALELAAAARELSLGVLLEIRGEDELELAHALASDSDGTAAVGVNARNLRDFSLDPAAQAALAPLLPPGSVKVAESGLRAPADAAALYRAGYRAFLVGEAFVSAAEPEAAVRGFAGALREAAKPAEGPGAGADRVRAPGAAAPGKAERSR